MLTRFLRSACYIQLKPRLSSSLSTSSNASFRSSRLTYRLLSVSGTAVTATILLSRPSGTVHADPSSEHQTEQHPGSVTSLSDLIRSYFVYTMCSYPTLVDWSPTILHAFTSVPGLKQLTEAFVEHTFFRHFVGGPTTSDCIPLLERLRSENKGVLFAYSVEVDEHEASGHASSDNCRPSLHKRIVAEMLRSIEVAADFEDTYSSTIRSPNSRRTWVAIKLTALVPNHEALINFSKYLVKTAQKKPYDPPIAFPGCPKPGDLQILRFPNSASDASLSNADITDLAELYQDLRMICAHAQKRSVRVIIDAEHSWYQPAIDAIALELMREFNRPATGSGVKTASYPLVYATFQAYLRRTPQYLAQSLKDAKAGGYILGAKLVRGAYHEQETVVHDNARSAPDSSPSISPDLLAPVWTSKAETDACYNTCARAILQAIASDRMYSVDTSKDDWSAWIFGRHTPNTPSVGVLFGSHNWDSVRLILQSLVNEGLARTVGILPSGIKGDDHGNDDDTVLEIPNDVADRVTLAQLYGMSDALTNYIVARTRSSAPFVIKYVPYGALSEVMPYLARRAIENKSVLGNGQAALERHEAWSEMKRRMSYF